MSRYWNPLEPFGTCHFENVIRLPSISFKSTFLGPIVDFRFDSLHSLFYVLMIVGLCLSFCFRPTLALSQGEISALDSIRSAWSFTSEIWVGPASNGCNWEYITCFGEGSESHITGIEISLSMDYSLHCDSTPSPPFRRYLPAAIGDLFYLETLDLRHLSLIGVIPDLSKLENLSTLYLYDLYSGELQATISQLPEKSLTSLALITCQNGALPSGISRFQKLKSLSLMAWGGVRNGLKSTPSGSLPWSLYDMRQLTSLSIHSTLIECDLSYFGPWLEYLHLTASLASGSLVDACEFPNLITLEIDNTYVNGKMPECLGFLPNLTTLVVSGNFISGPIPASFEYSSLEVLIASEIQGGGLLPVHLPKKLKSLVLSNSGFHGPIPNSISQLTHLVNLDLSDNDLSGTIPLLPQVGDLRVRQNSLTGDLSFFPPSLLPYANIDLAYNNFYGLIPEQLWASTSLDLTNNALLFGPLPNGTLPLISSRSEDGIPLSLSNHSVTAQPVLYLPNMVRLFLSSVSLGGFLPQLDAPLLHSLNLSNCYLRGMTGTFPPSLGRIDLSYNDFKTFLPPVLPPSIRFLQLSYAGFIGTIPSTLLSQSTISILFVDLAHNELEGTFPSIPGTLQDSVAVLLSFNKNLTGSLESIANSSSRVGTLEMDSAGLVGPIVALPIGLQILKLRNNNLMGRVPSYFELAELVELDLAGNKLGPDPLRFQSIKLKSLDISDNMFQFSVGAGFSTFPNLQRIIAGSNRLTGGILPGYSPQYPTYISLRNTSISGTINSGYLDEMLKKGLQFLDISDNSKLRTLPLNSPMVVAPWHASNKTGDIPPNVECFGITSEYFASSAFTTAPFIFLFDHTLFGYNQCKCAVGSYGRPPMCLTCDQSLSCDNSRNLAIPPGSFAYVDSSLFPEDLLRHPTHSNLEQTHSESTFHKNQRHGRTSHFPIVVEPCIGSEAQCEGINIPPDFDIGNLTFISAALEKQCKLGSIGRLCSQCQCTRENPPCYFPRGSRCVQCPKNWKIPSRTLFWSVCAVFAVLAYVLLTTIILLVLRSRRSPVSKPWPQLSLVKRIFYRILHFTELGFVPIAVAFIQILSEITHWDSHFLNWLSRVTKLLNVNPTGFGIWCLNPDFARPQSTLIGRQLLPFVITTIFIASTGTAAGLYRLIHNIQWKRRFPFSSSDKNIMPHLLDSPQSPSIQKTVYEEDSDQSPLLSGTDDNGSESEFDAFNEVRLDKDGSLAFSKDCERMEDKSNSYPAMALVSSVAISIFQFFYFSSALAAADALFTSQQEHTNGRYLISLPWLLVSESLGLRKSSFAFLILVVLGFPLCALGAIVYLRSRIYDPKISIYFGSLVNRYRPGFIWWEFVKIAYKLAVALVIRSMGSESIYLVGTLSFVIGAFVSVQLTLKPWKRGIENSVDAIGSVLLLVSMFTDHIATERNGGLMWAPVVCDIVFIISLVGLAAVFALKEETTYHTKYLTKHRASLPLQTNLLQTTITQVGLMGNEDGEPNMQADGSESEDSNVQ